MANEENNREDERITALEETVSHQSVMIDDLSKLVSDQWKQIDRMQHKLDTLTSRFLNLEETVGPAHENTKPPHY